MAENPRIEDLRRRLEKEPGSRVFAQLAEELRKVRPRERIARALRQAADIIDPVRREQVLHRTPVATPTGGGIERVQ